MRTQLVIVSLIGMLLVTCRGEDYTRELSAIDSLKKVLVATDSLIATFNTSDISKRAENIADNSKFIQYNMNKLNDTLDYSTALLLTEYRETGKRYRHVNEEVVRIGSAIDSMSRGLDHLKHDLQNNSLAEGVDGRASVVHESTQVSVISSYAIELKASIDNTRRSYDTLLPKVNAFVLRMSEKVATVQVP